MPDNKSQPKYPIDLGKKMDEMISSPESKPSDETFYPTLYLEWEKPYNFPDEGTMTVRFKKTSEETRKRNGGETGQRVNLDILEILDTKATKGEEKEEESTGDVVDREMKKVERKKKRAARAADKAYDAEVEAEAGDEGTD